MEDAGPLLHSSAVTAKQPSYKRIYMHSSTDEQKANTSSHQAQQAAPRPFVPICPSISPSSSLVMSL